MKPRRTTPTFRLAMVVLARFFDWRDALLIVKPETFLRWHRNAFRKFWRWKSSKPGRPPLPLGVREVVRGMARENPTWGEERISDELKLKLASGSHHAQSGNTWIEIGPAAEDTISGGAPSSATMPKQSSPVISSCQSRQPSRFSTYSWPWRSADGEFCTVMSPPIRQQNGLFSSFGRSWPTRILTDSSFMIGTASFRTSSTLHWRTSECAC